MSFTGIRQADAIFKPSGATAFSLRQCQTTGVKREAQVVHDHKSGAADASQISVNKFGTMATLATGDIKGLVDNFAIRGGLLLSPALTSDAAAVRLPEQANQAGGLPINSSGNSMSLDCRRGFAIWKSLKFSHAAKEGVTGELEIHALRRDDESTVTAADKYTAFYLTGSYTLATQTFNRSYDFGGVAYAGTAAEAWLDTAQSVEVDFGNEGTPQEGGGHLLPNCVDVETVRPKITIEFNGKEDRDQFTSILDAISTLRVFGKRRAAGATHVADATGEHILVTLTGGLSVVEGKDAENQARNKFTATLYGISASISAASAIALL
jgi:hypothetical protein